MESKANVATAPERLVENQGQHHRRLLFFLSRWLPVVVWMGLIFFLSGQSRLSTDDLRSSGFDWTSPLRWPAHFGLYFMLALLLWRALVGHRHCFALVFLVSSLYAASDEVHQTFIPGRSGGVADAVPDILGASVALSFVYLARRFGSPGRSDGAGCP